MPENLVWKDLKKKFLPLFKLWPFFVLVGITFIFFYPVWLKGYVPLPADIVVGAYYPWLDYKWGYPVGVPVKNPLTTDVVSFSFPMRMLAIDLLKSGQLPLWNPYILAGTPLLANFQSAPFSPTNFVYFFFDRVNAWSVQVMLQHIIASISMYILLRHWRISKVASLAGGVIFAYSGFSLIWSQWNAHTLTAAFIPLLLFFEDRWLKKSLWFDGLGIAITLCLQIFSGYPQVVLYTLVAIGLLCAFHIKENFFLYKAVFIGIFVILSFGLAAFQLLPGFELLSLSQREIERHPFDWAFLPWLKVITFFAPDYFGNHSTQNYWGPQDYTSNTGFVGVITFIFALIGVSVFKHSREVKLLTILAIISLLLSFPTLFSILLWKSGIVGFQAASAHRALIIFTFSIAALAALGFDQFLKEKHISLFKVYAFPTIVIGIFWFLSVFLLRYGQKPVDLEYNFFSHENQDYLVGIKNLILPTILLIMSFLLLWWGRNKKVYIRYCVFLSIIILLAFELFRFGWKFSPFSPRHIVFPQTPVLNFLVNQEPLFRTTGSGVIPINMRMPYKIESIEGYDAVYPLYMSQLIASLSSGISSARPLGRYAMVGDETARVLDILNVKYLLTLKKNDRNNPDPQGNTPEIFNSEKYSVAFEDKSVAVIENKHVLPRAFMVYDWDVFRNKQALETFLAKDFPGDKKIILENDPGVPFIQKKLSLISTVQYNLYRESESEIKVDTQNDGFLFISDLYYPGWKAYIDGVETKIYKANFAFRSVFIPSGKHNVYFVYRPESFFNGLKISAFSLLIITLICLFIKNKEILINPR